MQVLNVKPVIVLTLAGMQSDLREWQAPKTAAPRVESREAGSKVTKQISQPKKQPVLSDSTEEGIKMDWREAHL
jgi:hypothetical protein